ncbi:MAG: hypothetical protein WCG27_02795 [Pseudomonadota bacterium]
MIGAKPVIFVQPLAASLEELKDALSKEAEDSSAEVYDAASSAEIKQLLPIVGPTIIFLSSPAICEQILAENRKIIVQYNSKVILISASEIPATEYAKLKKLGLSEALTEPIPLKNLQHKIKILHRAMPTLEQFKVRNSIQEEKKVFTHTKLATIKTNEKMRVERGVVEKKETFTLNIKVKKNAPGEVNINTQEQQHQEKGIIDETVKYGLDIKVKRENEATPDTAPQIHTKEEELPNKDNDTFSEEALESKMTHHHLNAEVESHDTQDNADGIEDRINDTQKIAGRDEKILEIKKVEAHQEYNGVLEKHRAEKEKSEKEKKKYQSDVFSWATGEKSYQDSLPKSTMPESLGGDGEKKEEVTEEEQWGTLIGAEAKNMDEAIRILNLYLAPSVDKTSICRQISSVIHDKYKASLFFFQRQEEAKEFSMLYNSLYDFSMAGILPDQFEEFLIQESPRWHSLEITTWADERIKENNKEFIYPFYDQLHKVGVLVAFFPQGVDPRLSPEIEALLETARGIYMETIPVKKDKNEEENEVGFWKKLINKVSELFDWGLGKIWRPKTETT